VEPRKSADVSTRIEHTRDRVEDDLRVFDRQLFIPAIYDNRNKWPECLRIFQTQNECTDISFEVMTSDKGGGQTVSVDDKLVLTHEQVRWLHQQLGTLVTMWDREDAPNDPVNTNDASSFSAKEQEDMDAKVGGSWSDE
jgi:hypothetical protein